MLSYLKMDLSANQNHSYQLQYTWNLTWEQNK